MAQSVKVTIGDKELVCLICQNNEFSKVDTVLNERWLAVFDIEAFSKNAEAFICTKCGYAHEFITPKVVGYKLSIVKEK